MAKVTISKFSQTEIVHLVVSVLVMGFLIAYIMAQDARQAGELQASGLGIFSAAVYFIPLALVVIVPAFVLHEMGHKFVAQKFGFWAEYRMWKEGLLFAILIVLISKGQLAFIAPGAVYFAPGFGMPSKEKVGKVGLIGPVINILLAVAFGLFEIYGPLSLSGIGAMGAYVNSFLAIFNLIPLPPLDGQKVLAWDKKIWVLAMLLGVMVFLIASLRL